MRTFSQWLIWGSNVTAGWLEEKVANISNVAVLEMSDYHEVHDAQSDRVNTSHLCNSKQICLSFDTFSGIVALDNIQCIGPVH